MRRNFNDTPSTSKTSKVTPAARRFSRKRIIILASVLLAVIAAGATSVYAAASTSQAAERQEIAKVAAIKKSDQAFTAKLTKLRTDAKQAYEAKVKAEAEAKKKAEEEAKKKAEAEAKRTGIPAPTGGCAKSDGHSNPSSIAVVVNKKRCFNPLSFTPGDLVTTNGATISAKASADFNALMAGASAAGVPLTVTSSYRSYGSQVSTYNYWVGVSGRAGADRYSARPGYSEHQTGLAIDFATPSGAALSNFTGTPQQQWLAANAWQYGFIQRYTGANSAETGYDAESWHFRYIGRAAAASYTSSGSSSLERFWGVTGGDY